MASRKSPGIDPMGHPPFSKVKLEGPKVHHDDHGNNASVPAKGNKRAIPNEHWEKHYDLNAPSKNMEFVKGSDFCPKISDERKTTYLKVNKEDH